MAQTQPTPTLASLEEAITVLFCLVDDAYALLNPRWRSHESLKKLSDSEVLTLTLLQPLRGVESERSLLRDAQRFFSHLFPGVARMHSSSLHRRVRRLRRFLEPLRRSVLPELVGELETLIADSMLLEVLRPRQIKQSAGFEEDLLSGFTGAVSSQLSESECHPTNATQRALRCSCHFITESLNGSEKGGGKLQASCHWRRYSSTNFLSMRCLSFQESRPSHTRGP